jgi:hypothetical protein
VQENRKDHWWEEKEDVHRRVFDVFEHLDEFQAHHRAANLHHLRQYSNRMAAGLFGGDYAIQGSGERLQLNIIKSVVDAAVAQIATNRPRPMYLTEKGNYSQRTKAKRLGKFVMGQFYALDQYDISLDVFRDAAIFGTGPEKIYDVGGRICADKVFPNDLVVDDRESRDGQPRQMFQYAQVNRDVLAKSSLVTTKDQRQAVETAGLIREEQHYSESVSDPVSVIEAYHLPSAPGADDGRRVIAIDNCTLDDIPWKRGFPYAVFRWSKAPLGFYGIGIAEELTPIQVEINWLLAKIQMIANAAGNSVWIRKGENIGRISNKINSLNTYTNSPPVALNLAVIPPELLQQVQYLERKAYEIIGISQLSAASLKPAGLNSGEALKTYNDIGSQRFQHVGQRWEHFHVRQVSELILDCARDIEERGDGDIEVMAQGDKDVESIKFSEVSIEKDKYITKSWPVSLFPDTPAGKLDTIEKLAQVSPDVQRYLIPLLDFPDFDSVRSRINAPYELVEKQIEAMLEHGRPQTPLVAYMNIEEARRQGTLAILDAERDGAPEERIELLRQWVNQIDNAQELSTPVPQPAAPAAPQAGPPGPGLAPDPMAGVIPPMQ